MVDGCAKCVKYMVFIFNLLFWIIGLAILSFGIWVHVSKGDYGSIVTSVPFVTAATLIIVVGAIVMILGGIGCLGAWKENRCLLMTFFILMLLIFIVEVVAAVLGYIYKDKVQQYVESDLEKALPKYEDGLTGTWDRLQEKLECCGVNDYKDWWATFPSWSLNRLPDSCCKTMSEGCGRRFTTIILGQFYQEGCAEKLEKSLAGNLYVIGGICIGIAVIQLLAMVFAIFLCRQVGKESYV